MAADQTMRPAAMYAALYSAMAAGIGSGSTRPDPHHTTPRGRGDGHTPGPWRLSAPPSPGCMGWTPGCHGIHVPPLSPNFAEHSGRNGYPAITNLQIIFVPKRPTAT
jgi:hypothetical protein